MTFSFFFSSRRRHTRFSRDWSSDVCSSDLPEQVHEITSFLNKYFFQPSMDHSEYINTLKSALQHEKSDRDYGSQARVPQQQRSEERRVGKEGRARWREQQSKKKEKGGTHKV